MFGKSFNSKFKTTINNALAKIIILKKQHHSCWFQARSDVVQLLNLGHQESAILRADLVIREQNLLDALVIIEGYCCLLIERVALIRNTIGCPEELKEAIASLIFAASRFGQLPELQKISRIFMKKYGKEFINYATELRNNCGVNAKIAKRLPNRRTSLGTRVKVLKEIAAEHGIILQQQVENSEATEEKARKTTPSGDQELNIKRKSSEEEIKDEISKEINKYTSVKQAAQAACDLASEAAVAARAAVKLYKEDASLKEMKSRKHVDLDKIDAFEANFKKFNIQMSNESFRSKSKAVYTSESDSDIYNKKVVKNPEQDNKTKRIEVDPDGKEEEGKTRQSKHPWLRQHNWDDNKRFSSFMNDFLEAKNLVSNGDENHPIEDINENNYFRTTQDWSGRFTSEGISSEGSSRGRRPISVRKRRNRTASRRIRRPVSVRP